MKKILLIVFSVMMVVVMLGACTSDAVPEESTKDETGQGAEQASESTAVESTGEAAEPSTAAKDPSEITIAVIPKSLDNSIFLDAKTAAEDKAKELGIKLIWTASTASVAADQVTVIEGLIEQHVDAMLISCNDADALVDVINRATDAGIKVATFDSDSPDSKRLFYIGTNNHNAGVEACKSVKGLLPDGGTVAILTGVLGAPNLEERIDGFEEEAAGSNLKVLTIVSGNDDVQTSVEVVNQYTAGNPDLDAWWFDGGWPFFADPDALSELKTWREAGGKIVSIDTFYPMLQFVDLGMVDQLIGSDYIAMGSYGVQMLFDAINGKAVTEEYVDTGLEMCTKDNVDEVRSTKNEW